ncbi:hypothetical protein D3C72_2173010 [compost metagenome]
MHRVLHKGSPEGLEVGDPVANGNGVLMWDGEGKSLREVAYGLYEALDAILLPSNMLHCLS